MRKAWMTLGAMTGWFALSLQLFLSLQQAEANGKSILAGAVTYFSFFTILTNLLIAAQFSFPLWSPGSRIGRWFSRPPVQAASAAYIAIVGAIYSLLLRHIWDPQGPQKLADVLLHDVVPILYLGYWLALAPKQGLRWSHALGWLSYPLLYLAYSLVRGAATGWYPYPFIDVRLLGYPRALLQAAILTVVFYTVSLLVLALGRWLGKRQSLPEG